MQKEENQDSFVTRGFVKKNAKSAFLVSSNLAGKPKIFRLRGFVSARNGEEVFALGPRTARTIQVESMIPVRYSVRKREGHKAG